jgi:(1->4)-alpha-D-glucan 1-alpha-D-glucosylmutase
MEQALLDFLAAVIVVTENNPASTPFANSADRWKFIMKFQQVTGPIMAKGLEDTSFYRFFLLTSLNEVGGQPDLFGITVEDFHEKNLYRSKHWPYSMLSTTTHDAKRSEDVRCRISALSEMPEEWGGIVLKWQGMNEKLKPTIDNFGPVPRPNEEYLLYQTLLGVWPFVAQPTPADDQLIQRVTDYMMKAAKVSP